MSDLRKRIEYRVPENDGNDGIKDLVIARNTVPAIDDFMTSQEIDSVAFTKQPDGSYLFKKQDTDGKTLTFRIVITKTSYKTIIKRWGRISEQTYDRKSGIETERIFTDQNGVIEVTKRDSQYIEKATHTIKYPDNADGKSVDIDISKTTHGIMTSVNKGGLDISKLDAIGGPFSLMKLLVEKMKNSVNYVFWDEGSRDKDLIKKACTASELGKQCSQYGSYER